MGVLGGYLRIDGEWLPELLRHGDCDEIVDMLLRDDPSRYLDVDKSWDALDVLFGRVSGRHSISSGGLYHPTPDDWVRYRGEQVIVLTPFSLRPKVAAMRRVSFRRLAAAHDPATMAAVYPEGAWTDPAGLAPLERTWEEVRRFFAAALQSQDLVLIIIG